MAKRSKKKRKTTKKKKKQKKFKVEESQKELIIKTRPDWIKKGIVNKFRELKGELTQLPLIIYLISRAFWLVTIVPACRRI